MNTIENIIINNIVLSKEQTIPIMENKKISMIIAGAGSGKTLTMIGKIKYMLDNYLIKPEEVVVITYTNKAVEDIKTKLNKFCSKEIGVFTFHKLSLNILKKSNIEFQIAPQSFLEDTIEEFFQTKAFNNKFLLNQIYKYFHIYFYKNDKNYKKILKSKKYERLKKIIVLFINYLKCNNLEERFITLIKKEKVKTLLLIIYTIYVLYKQELESSNLLDFDKMIELATNEVRNNKVILPYKLLIIDEFQDTSLLRFNLIDGIVKRNNASLTVVGDDYQSIYKFQGCDLSLFLNFSKYFPTAKIYYLNETFRNSQQLIDVAKDFINKNPKQIKKQLQSQINLKQPIHLIYYKDEKSILLKIIKNLPMDKSIMILGRNNFDIKKYLDNYSVENSNLIIPNIKHNIRYLTIHSSKGLEADIVIIINVSNDTFGIPSQVKEEKVLTLLKKQEEYPFAEERRLFYVALTRTKSDVYLLVPKNNQSIFIREIKYNRNVITKYI